MILADEDKRKFVEWLDGQIFSAEEMAKASKNLGATSIGGALGKKFRTEALACQIVRKMLTDFETMQVAT